MQTRTVKHTYRAYPSPEQKTWLRGAFGAMRAVYNDYLWQKEQVHKGLQSKVTPLDQFSKLPSNLAWMRNYPQKACEQSRRHAETAYKNFFNGLSGARKDNPGKPKYKKRKNGQGSITWNGKSSIQIKKLNSKWSAVRIPKLGTWLKFKNSLDFPSSPTGVTLKLLSSGKYMLSFTVQQEIAEPKTEGPTVGIDLGLSDLMAGVSTDETRFKVETPRYYRRAERKLARLNKAFSRTKRGSKNREKARLALAKQHEKVAAQRLHFARVLASQLTHENQVIVFEKLNLGGMNKNRKLSKSFADAGLGQLVAAVESAAVKNGCSVLKVDPAFTSQTCCKCGVVDGKKDLSVRMWTCKSCGAVLDRDFNAAVNILFLAMGHMESLNDLGDSVSPDEILAVIGEEVTGSYKMYKSCKKRTRAKSRAYRSSKTKETS